jgi:hypothetical protein
MKPIEESRRVWQTHDVVESITRGWSGTPALFGEGQFWSKDRLRYGFLHVGDSPGAAPRVLWHGCITPVQADEVKRAMRQLGEVQDAKLDFMFATKWKVAWTEGAEPRIWDARGLRAFVDDGALVVVDANGERERFEPESVLSIHAEGRAYHPRTAVWVNTKAGEARLLVEAIDLLVPPDDPWEIYESWPLTIATLFATALSLPAPQTDERSAPVEGSL